jgi:DNA polymerase-1
VPKPLLVVDLPSLLFRAFYALPSSIKGPDGRPVNALLGSANMILREVEEHGPRAVVLCIGPDAAPYRVELFPAYHADREEAFPDELGPQWHDSPEFFGAFGWTVATHDALEADDLLGSFARREEKAGGRALIMTGDRDMFQCASKDVKVLYVSTGGPRGAELIGPKQVKERYGIAPKLVPDFIALRGDPSDGLPGAKGVGEKGAAELLRKHGSLEKVLESAFREPRPGLRKALTENPDQLLAFKEIATLRDEKVRRPRDKRTDYRSAAKAARDRAMNRLAERLEQAGKT